MAVGQQCKQMDVQVQVPPLLLSTAAQAEAAEWAGCPCHVCAERLLETDSLLFCKQCGCEPIHTDCLLERPEMGGDGAHAHAAPMLRP